MKKKTKVIAKVNVTSDFDNWWESDLSSLITADEGIEVTIISAIVNEGSLYLIYSYEYFKD